MKDREKRTTTVRLQNLSYGHKQSGTLRAALELDLFTRVSEGASSLREIAAALGLSDLNAERLVVACAALELLEKDGDDHRNAPDVERFLVKGKVHVHRPMVALQRMGFRTLEGSRQHPRIGLATEGTGTL